jgi:hypothetical protein
VSAQSQLEVVVDILMSADRIEDPLVKEKVLRQLRDLYMRSAIDTTSLALSKALAPKFMTLLETYGRVLMDAIEAAQREDRVRLKRSVRSIGTYLVELQMISRAPQLAPQVKTGALAGVESTDVLLKCGTTAALIYYYILSNGKVSRPELMAYYTGRNIPDDEANEAVKRLLENGLIKAEATGGEIYYTAVVGE